MFHDLATPYDDVWTVPEPVTVTDTGDPGASWTRKTCPNFAPPVRGEKVTVNVRASPAGMSAPGGETV